MEKLFNKGPSGPGFWIKLVEDYKNNFPNSGEYVGKLEN